MRRLYSKRFIKIFRYNFDKTVTWYERAGVILNDTIPIAVTIYFLTFELAVESMMNLLACESFDEGMEPRLVAMRSVVCTSPSYLSWATTVLFLVFLYAFFFPLMIVLVMRRAMRRLKEASEQEQMLKKNNPGLFQSMRRMKDLVSSSFRLGKGKSLFKIGDANPQAEGEAKGGGGAKPSSLDAATPPVIRSRPSFLKEETDMMEAERQKKLELLDFLEFSRTRKMKSAQFMRNFSFLLGGYEEEFFYWEIVIMIRKLSLLLILAFPVNNEDSDSRTFMVVFHASFFLIVQLWYRPYTQKGADVLNKLEALSLISWLLILIVFMVNEWVVIFSLLMTVFFLMYFVPTGLAIVKGFATEAIKMARAIDKEKDAKGWKKYVQGLKLYDKLMCLTRVPCAGENRNIREMVRIQSLTGEEEGLFMVQLTVHKKLKSYKNTRILLGRHLLDVRQMIKRDLERVLHEWRLARLFFRKGLMEIPEEKKVRCRRCLLWDCKELCLSHPPLGLEFLVRFGLIIRKTLKTDERMHERAMEDDHYLEYKSFAFDCLEKSRLDSFRKDKERQTDKEFLSLLTRTGTETPKGLKKKLTGGNSPRGNSPPESPRRPPPSDSDGRALVSSGKSNKVAPRRFLQTGLWQAVQQGLRSARLEQEVDEMEADMGSSIFEVDQHPGMSKQQQQHEADDTRPDNGDGAPIDPQSLLAAAVDDMGSGNSELDYPPPPPRPVGTAPADDQMNKTYGPLSGPLPDPPTSPFTYAGRELPLPQQQTADENRLASAMEAIDAESSILSLPPPPAGAFSQGNAEDRERERDMSRHSSFRKPTASEALPANPSVAARRGQILNRKRAGIARLKEKLQAAQATRVEEKPTEETQRASASNRRQSYFSAGSVSEGEIDDLRGGIAGAGTFSKGVVREEETNRQPSVPSLSQGDSEIEGYEAADMTRHAPPEEEASRMPEEHREGIHTQGGVRRASIMSAGSFSDGDLDDLRAMRPGMGGAPSATQNQNQGVGGPEGRGRGNGGRRTSDLTIGSMSDGDIEDLRAARGGGPFGMNTSGLHRWTPPGSSDGQEAGDAGDGEPVGDEDIFASDPGDSVGSQGDPERAIDMGSEGGRGGGRGRGGGSPSHGRGGASSGGGGGAVGGILQEDEPTFTERGNGNNRLTDRRNVADVRIEMSRLGSDEGGDFGSPGPEADDEESPATRAPKSPGKGKGKGSSRQSSGLKSPGSGSPKKGGGIFGWLRSISGAPEEGDSEEGSDEFDSHLWEDVTVDLATLTQLEDALVWLHQQEEPDLSFQPGREGTYGERYRRLLISHGEVLDQLAAIGDGFFSHPAVEKAKIRGVDKWKLIDALFATKAVDPYVLLWLYPVFLSRVVWGLGEGSSVGGDSEGSIGLGGRRFSDEAPVQTVNANAGGGIGTMPGRSSIRRKQSGESIGEESHRARPRVSIARQGRRRSSLISMAARAARDEMDRQNEMEAKAARYAVTTPEERHQREPPDPESDPETLSRPSGPHALSPLQQALLNMDGEGEGEGGGI
uniref:Uncharacterized protein n=1 Tax=Chromera velia CCMP2878 TaxID=1169474 RepID=A0A0G4HA00_9ALVE|eukprot:Cvel_6053.t1-p1 / transcript=Cvel_6053.t1 / gene=Cvel_6053 / organism=Chromera_velia_CCMP2878 / gene_product=hypothetical protein / transcript_product=hypothetical protein / location=Cvel_scaffold291:22971-30358(+) / protein_length=1522 / sequence_SO=supercontig / SO=protein_coding / is_pseudo=false